MFRRWIHSFIKRYRNVIIEILKKIGILVGIILIGIIIMSSVSRKEDKSQTENSISIYNPTKTVIKGTEVKKEEFEEDNKIIRNFIDYCNSNKIESAYSLLSNQCKELLYPTIQDFEKKYYNTLFSSKREYNLQSWINEGKYHTYQVRFIEDILSTGKYDDSKKGQDYITIDLSLDEPKLNIGGYIKEEAINKETSNDIVNVLAVKRNVYMEYEEYYIKINNKSDYKILLDTNTNLSSIKLVDENNVKYAPFKKEIKNLNDELSSDVIRPLKIKFNRPYSSNVRVDYIEFSDIVPDVQKYNSSNNYTDRVNVKIKLR